MKRGLLPKHVVAVVRSQKDPLKALEMFNSAKMETGFSHTLFTYKCMVEKLGFHGEFESMEGLLSEMRMNFDNGSLEGVYIGAIRNYGRCGKIQEAVNIFERMDFYNCEPSVRSYNTIMNLLIEFGFFDQAHKVYMRMRHNGIFPDVYSHTIRIKSLCRTHRPHSALRLLRNMASQGCESNDVAYCTVVAGFFEAGFDVEAYHVFEEMLGLGICPDVARFNKLVDGLARKGLVSDCERILSKVLKRGVSPNLFTFNIFVQGLCKKGLIDQAIRLLDSVAKDGLKPDVVTYNTLICGLCKSSKVEEAEGYLRKMANLGLEPDGFTYNSVIYGYCKTGKIRNADEVFRDAVYKGFVPDEFTYCALIDGLWNSGDTNRAMAVFDETMRKEGMNPSVVMYNTMIKGFCQHGLILEALRLMSDMEDNGCRPEIWTYNLVVNGLCKIGCVSDASRLVDDAISRGCVPDIFTFNTLIDGHCKDSSLDNAIELVGTMWDHGVEPDIITFNTLLNGLCKARRYDDVAKTFEEMTAKALEPNIITYNILVESLCRSRRHNEALRLVEEIREKGFSLDTVSFGTLISGFCQNGDLDGAYKLFRRAERDFKVSHTTSTYNIMINAFCGKLKVTAAQRLFSELTEKVNENNGPDSYTYRVMIDGFCRAGNFDLAYKFLLEKIEKGFVPSLSTFGRVMNCLCVNHRIREAVLIVYVMVQKGIVPEEVGTIFEADKKEIAAPKIVVEDLLKKNCITYYTYELLYDGIRDKKIVNKRTLTGLLSQSLT